MTFEPWLSRWAQQRPNGLALVAPEGRLSWSELHQTAGGVGSYLVQAGVQPGDRVGIVLPPGLDCAVVLHACFLIGAVAVPIHARLTKKERDAQLIGAGLVVDNTGLLNPRLQCEVNSGRGNASDHSAVVDHRASKGGDAAEYCAPPEHRSAADQLALVIYTSGTSGRARPIEISWAAITANAFGSAVALGLDRHERWICPMPLAHVGGCMILLRSLVYGTTAVLAPPPFAPPTVSDVIKQERATLISVVPTMLKRLLDHDPAPLRSLRCVLVGGAPLDSALIEHARSEGVAIAQTYGLTEACSQVTVSAVDNAQTAGWPINGVELKVAHDGEILVRGATLATNAQRDAAGYLHTGDIGELTAEGLILKGRKTDIIISGGENVAPQEVEAVLLNHPDIREVAVFGRAHPEWGEAVTAQIVLASDANFGVNSAKLSGDEIREFSARELAAFKVPKTVEFVNELPRTHSGKVARSLLK